MHVEYRCKLCRIHKVKLYPYIHYKKYSLALPFMCSHTAAVFYDFIYRKRPDMPRLLHKLLQKKVITPCLESRYFSFFVG